MFPICSFAKDDPPKNSQELNMGRLEGTVFQSELLLFKRICMDFFGVWVSVLDDTNAADVVIVVVGVTTLQISTLNNC